MDRAAEEMPVLLSAKGMNQPSKAVVLMLRAILREPLYQARAATQEADEQPLLQPAEPKNPDALPALPQPAAPNNPEP